MVTYKELTDLTALSKDGDCNAAVELALLLRSDYAHIKLGEAVRLLHALLFRCIAMQLSQSYKPLLEKVPNIGETANLYKAEPGFGNLQNLIDILVAVGQKVGEPMLTDLGIVISRAFKTAANEIDAIMGQIMPEYAADSSLKNAIKPFKEQPSLRTFIETVKQLNDTYKSYCDAERCEQLLMFAVDRGNQDAVKYMQKFYNEPISQLKADARLNGSLLGSSYVFTTIWDKAHKYSNPF